MGIALASSPQKRCRLALQALEEAHDSFRSSWLVTGKRVVKGVGIGYDLIRKKTFFFIII